MFYCNTTCCPTLDRHISLVGATDAATPPSRQKGKRAKFEAGIHHLQNRTNTAHSATRTPAHPRVLRMLVLGSRGWKAHEHLRPVAAVILPRAPLEGVAGEARLHHTPLRLHLF